MLKALERRYQLRIDFSTSVIDSDGHLGTDGEGGGGLIPEARGSEPCFFVAHFRCTRIERRWRRTSTQVKGDPRGERLG